MKLFHETKKLQIYFDQNCNQSTFCLKYPGCYNNIIKVQVFGKIIPQKFVTSKKEEARDIKKRLKNRKIKNTSKNYPCLFDQTKNFILLFEVGRNAEFI